MRGAGPDPDRVLLTGSTSAVGWGVINHDLGLAGYLARMTAVVTQRGLNVEVAAEAQLDAASVTARLSADVTSRYDAVVLTVGLREALEFMPVDLWMRRLTSLLDRIQGARNDPPGVVIVGAEEVFPVPLPGWFTGVVSRRARELNATSREIVAGRERVRYVDSGMLPAPGDPSNLFDAHRSELYRRAAAAIVPALAPLLDQSHSRQTYPVNEEARRHALDHLRNFSGNVDDVTQLLERLRRVLQVRSVDLYIVDRDTVSTLSTTSQPLDTRDRRPTISTIALEYRNGFVVEDTLRDDRFRNLPQVTGEPYLRFYAAHPVESPDGHRVALLSVVHTEPLRFSESELALLRSYAVRVGAVLFAGY